MRLETWIALGSFGMSVLFVTLIISFYSFLIGPEGQGPERVVDPSGLLIQQVAISAAPSIILAVVVFIMARSSGAKSAGLLLLAGGAIMIGGMYYATTLLPMIPPQFVVGGIGFVPYLLMAAGAVIAAFGGYLASKIDRRTTHLDGLR